MHIGDRFKVEIRNMDGAGDDPTQGCLACGDEKQLVELKISTTCNCIQPQHLHPILSSQDRS